MPRSTEQRRRVTPKPIRQGEQISLPCEGGYVRVPAPTDGVYFEVHEDGFFVSARELWDVLDKLI